MCHLNPIGTITGTVMEHSHYRPIHIPAGGSGGRGVGGGVSWLYFVGEVMVGKSMISLLKEPALFLVFIFICRHVICHMPACVIANGFHMECS